ncbi:hypothetical protein I4I21_12975 [Lactiplantibacillus plantarum]|uniref:hypothetical protein n=1 Tax=Lactiplantibacillus plantarum TaxID=1590 RepID=UPI0018B008A1|nr:hypothetical protein [Lactiplantibacillus plantarum]MBF9193648.1 hypothetical protein [Lactiplantibacillus plantarum]MCJ1648677.1 hypothetical protein [Lactiplantibacillus plantarum subsp. plantarum]
MKLKNQQEDFNLLGQQLLVKGLSTKEFGDSPFFDFMAALNARKKKDRSELVDPLEAINQTYGL